MYVYTIALRGEIDNNRQFALISNITRIYRVVIALMISVASERYFYPLDFYGLKYYDLGKP